MVSPALNKMDIIEIKNQINLLEKKIYQLIKLIRVNLRLLPKLIRKEIKYCSMGTSRKRVILENKNRKIVVNGNVQDFCQMDDEEIYVIDLIKKINDYLYEFELISDGMIIPDEKIKKLLNLESDDPIYLLDLGKVINKNLVKG